VLPQSKVANRKKFSPPKSGDPRTNSGASRGTWADPDSYSPKTARSLYKCPLAAETSSRLPAIILMISGDAVALPNKRTPQLGQKPRRTILPLSPVTSWYFTSPVMLRHSGDKNCRSKCAACRLLAIAAVAIPHGNRVSRTFVADVAAHTTASKTSRHGVSLQRLLFQPYRFADSILANALSRRSHLLFFVIGLPSLIAGSSIPQLHFFLGLILIYVAPPTYPLRVVRSAIP
jgi:hypothetical protein